MSFIIVDQINKNRFDINSDSYYIDKCFRNYSKNQKDKRELDKDNKKYQKCFKKEMSQHEIVTYLINTNEELYETYKIY